MEVDSSAEEIMQVHTPTETIVQDTIIRHLTGYEKYVLEHDKALLNTHIDLFGDLVNHHGPYQMQSVDLYLNPATIKQIPPGKPNLQILFQRWPGFPEEEPCHAICTYYDGKVNHIYDSMNSMSLKSDSEIYLHKLYGHDIVNEFHIVDKQKNNYDCGLFAMAFATTIFCEEDPESPVNKKYNHRELRKHAIEIFTTKELIPFPTMPNSWSGTDVGGSLAPQFAIDFR